MTGKILNWQQTQNTGYKNQLINGEFLFWQRGTSFNQTNNLQFMADRWFVNRGTGTANFTVDRSTDVPAGSRGYSLQLQKQSGDVANIVQPIELPGHLSGALRAGPFQIGTTWTLSFDIKMDVSDSITVGSIFRSTSTSSTNQQVAITPATSDIVPANTWTKASVTFTINASPNPTNNSLIISIQPPSTATDVFVTNVQLESGNEITNYEQRGHALELALCQRYYEKSYDVDTPIGTTTGRGAKHGNDASVQNAFHCYCDFKVNKRTLPTVVIYSVQTGAANTFDQVHGLPSPSGTFGVSFTTSSETNISFINATTNLTPQDPNNLFAFHFTADAEL